MKRAASEAPAGLRQGGLFLHVLPTVAYAVALLVMGTAPSGSVPSPEVGDKSLHLLGFGALMLMVTRSVRYLAPKFSFSTSLLVAGSCSMGLGVLLELLQAFTPDRTPEVADLLADLLGVVLAAGGFLVARSFMGSEDPTPS